MVDAYVVRDKASNYTAEMLHDVCYLTKIKFL